MSTTETKFMETTCLVCLIITMILFPAGLYIQAARYAGLVCPKKGYAVNGVVCDMGDKTYCQPDQCAWIK